MTFQELISDGNITLKAVSEFLDSLDHAGRLEAIQSTSKAQQKALFSLAAGGEALTPEDFVPSNVADNREVIHHGWNTLPVLRSFQKRFARQAGPEQTLVGYNEGLTRKVIGPGYFVLRSTEERAEWQSRGAMVVDYFLTPEGQVPAQWPSIRPNSKGLQVLVYHHTRDFMRKLSEHVTIGEAYKDENPMNNWFLLVREDI